MSEAPKRVWVGYSITGAPAWSVNPHEARGHDKATLYISDAALRELCEKWRKEASRPGGCDRGTDVLRAVTRWCADDLESLLEGKED